MSIGIYKITSPSGKVYIGKSINIEKRWDVYLKIYGCEQQVKLFNSLCKYGSINHIFEIIEECSIEQLNEREIYYIKLYDSINNGLNLTEGGDGGNLNEESEELRRINSMKPILQYDLEGNFIKEYIGATEAIKYIGKGNSNNINDCARGKYKSTYGYRWLYKNNEIISKLPPLEFKPKGSKWTDERRQKTKQSRIGETRSDEYKEKIRKLKMKNIYQYDVNNNLTATFGSYKLFDGSKIIGTKKLRSILNKNIYYKGYKYSHEKY